MKNQVLSVEQMKHLKELGVDTSKASCCWCSAYDIEQFVMPIEDTSLFDSDKLTFTLQDMLEMMPEMIEQNNILFFLLLKKQYGHYMCGYVSMFKREGLCFFAGEKILTCAYKTLCWCAENGYLKGGNNGND